MEWVLSRGISSSIWCSDILCRRCMPFKNRKGPRWGDRWRIIRWWYLTILFKTKIIIQENCDWTCATILQLFTMRCRRIHLRRVFNNPKKHPTQDPIIQTVACKWQNFQYWRFLYAMRWGAETSEDGLLHWFDEDRNYLLPTNGRGIFFLCHSVLRSTYSERLNSVLLNTQLNLAFSTMYVTPFSWLVGWSVSDVIYSAHPFIESIGISISVIPTAILNTFSTSFTISLSRQWRKPTDLPTCEPKFEIVTSNAIAQFCRSMIDISLAWRSLYQTCTWWLQGNWQWKLAIRWID